MTRNLTVHFKRNAYLVQPTEETLAIGGRRVLVHEWEDGRVELHCAGRILPHRVLDKNPIVNGAALIDNTRLGAVLSSRRRKPPGTMCDLPRASSLCERRRGFAKLVHSRKKRRVWTERSLRKADISTWAESGHLYFALT
jgi:hypothetical protein